MADARNFIYNSDYPTPAFVASWTGSFNLGSYAHLETGFAHNLPFAPLVVGQWSLNANFEPAYDIATTNGYFFGVSFNQVAGSNDTQIRFILDNGYGSNRTYYYRLFAFAPSDYDGDIPSIEDATDYRFNSDFNYLKLFAYGKQTVSSTRDFVVNHNLGYLPQVRTWLKDTINNITAPISNIHYQDNPYTTGTVIDTSKLTIKNVISGDTVYYHIYADEV